MVETKHPQLKGYWFYITVVDKARKKQKVVCRLGIAQNYNPKTGNLVNSKPCPYAELAAEYGYMVHNISDTVANRIKQEFMTELLYDARLRAESLRKSIIPYQDITDGAGIYYLS